ncbi:MAG TPA: hypothetical protein V6D12_02195, partial [Candidatus Obscuribacterales bacterium]
MLEKLGGMNERSHFLILPSAIASSFFRLHEKRAHRQVAARLTLASLTLSRLSSSKSDRLRLIPYPWVPQPLPIDPFTANLGENFNQVFTKFNKIITY